ncbi:MAG: winged helix-turn-helix transcriptional regulator [Gemmatimonadaceae bacterium]|jgi:ArsR family transcriptional regulator|nr:winged helix-turn-helix transcriptional regulator [Gemmatimonadaceae bacterium]
MTPANTVTVVDEGACCATRGATAVAERGTDHGVTGSLDAADVLFKGFADPTRLRILNVLAAGELCVCDIVEILDVVQPTVSRHLAYLRRSGLVTVTRDWKFAHYRLAEAATPVHRRLLGCVAECFRGIAELDEERALAEARVGAREAAPCD